MVVLTVYGTCECGCGAKTRISPKTNRAKGWIKGKPRRFVHGHHGRRPVSYVERPCGYRTACWIWGGDVQPSGYGRLIRGDKRWLAHRWMYERLVGPIPEGKHLDHLCRNPSCVRPEHLEAVTPRTNTRRSRATFLTAADAFAISWMAFTTTIRQVDIARAFGVSQQNVCDILKGRHWRPAW